MKQKDANRRDFLKLAGTAAPAAVVLTASGNAQAAPAEPDLDANIMQDTAHTRAYLDSAKF
ncbi:MAG: twin-arginine translocation signal domain-containing protein [Litoreibacter sp.]